MAIVEVAPNESIDSALRRFKRIVQREGVIADVKRHRFFIPPGEKRRLKSELARKQQRSSMRECRMAWIVGTGSPCESQERRMRPSPWLKMLYCCQNLVNFGICRSLSGPGC